MSVFAASGVGGGYLHGAITPADWWPMTITGHVRRKSNTGTYNVLLMLGVSGYNPNYLQLYLDDNTTEDYRLLSIDNNFVNGGNAVHGLEVPILDGWHTFAFTFDERDSVGYNSIYLDGVHHPGLPMNVTHKPSPGFIRLFRDTGGDFFADVELASIKLFTNIEMNAAQRAAELARYDAVDTEHLVANYHLIEDALDKSGNGYDLTAGGTGGVTFQGSGPSILLPGQSGARPFPRNRMSLGLGLRR